MPTASRSPRRSTAPAPAPQVVFGVILGTGVGGGVVVHGRLVEGVNAIGGEWGHIPLPTPLDDERPGPLCSCGIAGHIEAWLSGPNFAADYARRNGIARRGRPEGPGDRRPRRGRRRRRRGEPPPLRGPPRPLPRRRRQHPRPRRHRPRRRPLQRLPPLRDRPAADRAACLRRQVQHPPGAERPRRQLRRPRRRLALAPDPEASRAAPHPAASVSSAPSTRAPAAPAASPRSSPPPPSSGPTSSAATEPSARSDPAAQPEPLAPRPAPSRGSQTPCTRPVDPHQRALPVP